jgi:class III poly(R)-hydroxyalkanoic acid synthase PhaE subunit
MDWVKQSQEMMTAWAKTQQAMWEEWSQMFAPQSNNLMEQWQQMAQDSVKAWTENADETAQSVAERMVSSQAGMMRMLDLTMQVWQNMVGAGDDWPQQLDKQMDKIRAELVGNVNATNNVNELWQRYIQQWQGFFAPWTNAAAQSATFGPAAAMGDKDALLEMTKLYWDAYQDTFGQMLQAPGLGYSREWDEKLRQGFASYVDLQEAALQYQVVMADMWVQSYEELVTEMMEEAADGEPVGVRGFLNRWSTTADRVFKSAFASQEYITIQSRFVNMLMLYRKRQREIMEVMLEYFDLPTRDEVDESHRRIYELRKEVKQLRRELAAIQKHIDVKK